MHVAERKANAGNAFNAIFLRGRVTAVFAVLVIVLFPADMFAQSDPGNSGGGEREDHSEEPAEEGGVRGGFLNSLFVTTQFGGGTMISAGAGLAFFDDVVRPEVLLGYTPEGEFEDFSVTAKLNTRIIAVPLSDRVGLYGGLGTNFTFFSGNARVASAAFLSQELDVRDVIGIPRLGFFLEEHFYFVESEDSSVVFQLGLGLRASLF